jgi:2-methylisocitrate lyase-like PEP mutase family enzyme
MKMQLSQPELYEKFKALHERTGGFIMPNAWDAGSAVILKNAGFEALGTSSAALAASLGRLDGRHAVSREEHITHARLLTEITRLPVNGDLEDGFGSEPEEVVLTVKAAISAGLAGLGIEDTTANPEKPIHDFELAVARIQAAAKVSKGRILLTARADNFLHGRPDLDDTIKRLIAFAEAGADVLYAPNLPDWDAVSAVVEAVKPKPVNLLVGTSHSILPWDEVQRTGIKRLSLGADLYSRSIWHTHQGAMELLAGDIATGAGKKASFSTNEGFGSIYSKIKQSLSA